MRTIASLRHFLNSYCRTVGMFKLYDSAWKIRNIDDDISFDARSVEERIQGDKELLLYHWW
jgi:hypothetical protein